MKTIRTFVNLTAGKISNGRFHSLMPQRRQVQQPLEMPSTTRVSTRKSGDDSEDDVSQFITAVRNSAGELPLPMPSTMPRERQRYRERVRKLRMRNLRRRALHKEEPLEMPSTMK